MRERKQDAAADMATVRAEVTTYLKHVPDTIRTHGGGESVGYLALSLGKLLCWIGPMLDRYDQPKPDSMPPEKSVAKLGEEIRALGMELLSKPDTGEMIRTIQTLERYLDLMKDIQRQNGGAK